MGPSPAARRFAVRLRILQVVHAALRAFDLSDAITVTSLAFVFVGLAMPSAAFGVVGFLLLPMTPIWTSIRLLVRGR